MIADDNADDLLLFELAFRRAGFTNPILSVPDGDLVIDYLSEKPPFADRKKFPAPQLLILDLKMQRLGGLDVLTWVRNSPQWRCLPVIILTTSIFGLEIKQAYERGANSFITKPNEFTDFVRSVKQMGDYWLRQSQIPNPAAYPIISSQVAPDIQAPGGKGF